MTCNYWPKLIRLYRGNILQLTMKTTLDRVTDAH